MVTNLPPLSIEIPSLMQPKFKWRNPIDDQNWRSNLDGRKLQRVKEFSFYLRDWIRDYSTKIFPTHAINIPLGSVNDNPQQLGNIFRD